MAKNTVIIDGEAPETDSEDEHCSPKPSPLKMPKSIQGAAVVGEDSESENDISAVSASVNSPMDGQDQYNSLLHKKLRENNRNIHKSLDDFTQKTVTEANESLNNTEQQLVKTQVTLQNALSSLRQLNSNSVAIKNKLRLILSSRFLPNVSTE